MDMKIEDFKAFHKYKERFERNVLLKGLKKGILGRKALVSRKKGRLAQSNFGKIMGTLFYSDVPCAFDYYGLVKKSTELLKKFVENPSSVIETQVVHFASVKIEHIIELDKSLVEGFPEFKKIVIQLRGFSKPRKRG